MTAPEYATWQAHHATLFWMTTGADEALFAAWRPLVMPYDLEDFLEGSNYLATQQGSAFRSTHLSIIVRRIRERRQASMAADTHAADRAAQHEHCSVCGDTGAAIVPHGRFVVDGKWVLPYPTWAVYCRCTKGRNHFERAYQASQAVEQGQTPRPRPMSWDRYEAMVPDWFSLMMDRANLAKDELHARRVSEHADRTSPLQLAGAIDTLRQRAAGPKLHEPKGDLEE